MGFSLQFSEALQSKLVYLPPPRLSPNHPNLRQTVAGPARAHQTLTLACSFTYLGFVLMCVCVIECMRVLMCICLLAER